MRIIKTIFLLPLSIIIVNCNNFKKNNLSSLLNSNDTIYILFEKNINGMNKSKFFQYKDNNPTYYKIVYDFPIYWKEEIRKEFAKETYGKEYIKNNSEKRTDYFLFEGVYNHSFWFGTYKILPEYPEFDDSEIFGNSKTFKKPKSFLKREKEKIIDYECLKKLTPPKVWSILKSHEKKANKPVLFIIDRDEYTKDSITLRNVIYYPENIE